MIQLLTARQVAKQLQCSTGKVYDLKGQGAIPWVKIGGSVRFKQSDVDEYIGQSTMGKPPRQKKVRLLRNLS